MGNRSASGEQRYAAGTDVTNNSKSSELNTTSSSSSEAESQSNQSKSEDSVRKAVAEHNAAALRMEYNALEEEWDTDFSTVSRSEMTTSDPSNLPTPGSEHARPIRVPVKKSQSNTGAGPNTTSGDCQGSSVPPPSPLSATDTWYGLPSLIETVERSELEQFAKPGPEDAEWVAQTHRYFDSERAFSRKQAKPTVGRRLRIGQTQKKRWSKMIREMALRHPVPVNPAPFPLSKAAQELKLRPEKRFTMPHN
ncbi:hypothetical protein Q1695_002709 [Nippostrongylus brasiliensis]|nr:hypothetical protein Q1695_002709 [Nippostrongylus brasiliensis]